MLRNFNNLPNTSHKLYNICQKMIKMVSKVVFQGKEQTTFRQIERLGILVPTPQAPMPCLMEVNRKVQVCRISK